MKNYNEYSKSELGNFFVVDETSSPHPYCIGPRHIHYAADKYYGKLTKECIIDSEKDGAHCCMSGCILPYERHEKVLIIQCNQDFKLEENKRELHKYLLSIKELTEKNGYVGFAFQRNF